MLKITSTIIFCKCIIRVFSGLYSTEFYFVILMLTTGHWACQCFHRKVFYYLSTYLPLFSLF